MKKLLIVFCCIVSFALNALSVEIIPIEKQEFSTFTSDFDNTGLNSRGGFGSYFAKDYKGGSRGE